MVQNKGAVSVAYITGCCILPWPSSLVPVTSWIKLSVVPSLKNPEFTPVALPLQLIYIHH